MNDLHEKSPCCRGKIRRFGNRRRQCSICLQTWSVWKRKRGAKRKRISFSALYRYLKNNNGPLKKPYLRARMRRDLKVFNQKTRWPKTPSGPLIAIADGMIQRIGYQDYTFYFILLKKVDSNQAIIKHPLFLSGLETSVGWKKAFDSLPKKVRKRIIALVCDGRSSLINLSRERGWFLQRCHFHLRARISQYTSLNYLSRSRQVAQEINCQVRIILTSRQKTQVKIALDKLEKLQENLRSASLKRVLSGFLHNYEDYRTYLLHPKLNLPSTTNTAESLISLVRDLQRRARGFNSLSSLKEWITGLLKHQKNMTCNGYKNQQN